MKCVIPLRHDQGMELLMNIAAGAAALLMIVVGGYAILALWWDDLS
jgi:hypothetical protein